IGGPDGAREKLEEFWRRVSSAGQLYSPVRSLPWEKWLQGGAPLSDFSPTFFVLQAMTHIFSPYHINPFNLNPLKEALAELVDFARLTKCNNAPDYSFPPPMSARARSRCSRMTPYRSTWSLRLPACPTFSMLSKSMGSTIGTAGSWAIPQSLHWFTIAVPKT